jgi:hypothetical protein
MRDNINNSDNDLGRKYTFESTGDIFPVCQLLKEMKECSVPRDCEQELVRWNHCNLGIVFDTVNMYRIHCGHETLIGDLNTFRPCEI